MANQPLSPPVVPAQQLPRRAVPSPVTYPMRGDQPGAQIPAAVTLPKVPALVNSSAAPLSPLAAAPASPAFDMRYTDFVANVFPCAGGHSIRPSNVPARMIASPAEAVWAESKDPARGQAIIDAVAKLPKQYPMARPWPGDKK